MNLRIGIAGIAIESSTFSPHRAGLADFDVRRGEDLLRRYDFLGKEWAQGVDWVPLLHARSLPGGAVLPEVYDDLSAEIIDKIGSAGELDGFFFDIHGAMSVVGRQRRRGRSGHPGPGRARARRPRLDLDGPARQRLPRARHGRRPDHLLPDGAARGRAWRPRSARPATWSSGSASGRGKPGKAWIRCRCCCPVRRPPPGIEPARVDLRGGSPRSQTSAGVLDAAIWVGYAWADEPRCRAAVVVTGDDAAADHRARRPSWPRRTGVHGTTSRSSRRRARWRSAWPPALASTARPFLISDSGDNPTAGGAGDVSWTLGQLLTVDELTSGNATAIHASITDPDAVAACVAAGVGARSRSPRAARSTPVRQARSSWPARCSRCRRTAVGGTVAVVKAGGLHVDPHVAAASRTTTSPTSPSSASTRPPPTW